MAVTKNELMEKIVIQDDKIEELHDALRIERSKRQELEKQVSVANQGRKKGEAAVNRARDVISAELNVHHGVDIFPQTEWSNGQEVSTEEDNSEIRLLRHLHQLLSTSP